MTKSRHTLRSVLMILLAAVMSVPFYYIVVNTFKTQQETTNSPLALPTHWVFDNYIKVFEGTPVVPSLMNTVYVMAISIFLTLAIGSLAAFGQITGRSRISQIIGAVLVAAFIIPELQLRAAYRLPAG